MNDIPAYRLALRKKAALWNIQKIVGLVLIVQGSIKKNLLQYLGSFRLTSATLLSISSICIKKYSIQMFAQSKTWADSYGFSNHGLQGVAEQAADQEKRNSMLFTWSII